jgi:hypothetical protein
MGSLTVLTAVAPKLSKLLPMLSSTADGEVVNTARAIERTLKGIGADWHDLAAALTTPSKAWMEPAPEPKPQARAPERPKPSGPRRWEDMSHIDRICALDWLRFWGELSAWERKLAGDIEDLITAKPRIRLSEKQVAHLNGILRKEWEWWQR